MTLISSISLLQQTLQQSSAGQLCVFDGTKLTLIALRFVAIIVYSELIKIYKYNTCLKKFYYLLVNIKLNIMLWFTTIAFLVSYSKIYPHLFQYVRVTCPNKNRILGLKNFKIILLVTKPLTTTIKTPFSKDHDNSFTVVTVYSLPRLFFLLKQKYMNLLLLASDPKFPS